MEIISGNNNVVSEKMIVSIRYKMTNGKGDILEDIRDGAAVSYLQGSGNILPQLENELLGLSVGEEKTIHIANDDQYAGPEDDFYFEAIIDNIRSATVAELASGGPLPEGVDITDCGPDCDCY